MSYKIFLLFVVIISFNQSFGQESEILKLLTDGNKAFQNSRFEVAKQKYEATIKIDSINKNALFNLAGTELKLGNNIRACELLQKLYSLGDFDAYELIKTNCDGLKYAEKMFLFHVDELPKFKFKNEFKPLIVNRQEINPDYIALLASEIKKSKELRRIKGRIYFILNVDINGVLITKIKGKISEERKTELVHVLKKMTEYKPAVYQNANVGLFGGGFTLPLSL